MTAMTAITAITAITAPVEQTYTIHCQFEVLLLA